MPPEPVSVLLPPPTVYNCCVGEEVLLGDGTDQVLGRAAA